MQAARRATECFQQALASSTRGLFRNRHGMRDQNEMVRSAPLPETRMKAAAASLAREVEPWFILVSILSTPRANFHARGLAGRLTRPAEAGSDVSLAGLRAHAGWRATGQRIVSR